MVGRVVAQPARGEVWLVDFDPTFGHEQAGRRPALVISTTPFNQGPAELAVVLPLTRRASGIRWHVAVDPPEGGLRARSYIKCEDVRSVSTRHRFVEPWGRVSAPTLADVEARLRILLDL